MASIKISELEEVTKLSTSDVLPIINENKTKKVSLEKLNEILGGNTNDTSTTKALKIEYYKDGATFDTEENRKTISEYYTALRKGEAPELFIAFNEFDGSVSGDNSYMYRASVISIDDYNLSLYCPTQVNTSSSQNRYGVNYNERYELEINVGIDSSNNNYNATYINHYYTKGWSLNGNSSILGMNNTTAFTPTGDYNPATKKYVDDAVANIDIPEGDGGNSGLPQPMYFVVSNNITIGSDNTDSDICAKFGEILTNARAFWNANGMHQIVLIDNKDYTNVIFKSKPGSFGTYYGTCYYPKVFDTLEKTYELKLTYSSSNSIYTVTKFRINEITVKRTATDPTENNQVATKKYVDDSIASINIPETGGEGVVKESPIIDLKINASLLSGNLNITDEEILGKVSDAFTKYNKGEISLPIFNVMGSLTSIPQLIFIHESQPTTIPLNGNIRYTGSTIHSVVGNLRAYTTILSFTVSSDSDNNCTVNGMTFVNAANGKVLLTPENTSSYTPTGDYNPATKKYVDDAVKNAITSVLEAEY